MSEFRMLILVAILFCYSCQSDTTTIQTPSGETEISNDELLKILGEGYLYGYPLVLMDITKNVTTNVEVPDELRPLAPTNQLGHFRIFPDHTLTAIVKPNVDTYYSISWLDLSKGPQVLSMPATDRYYVLPFYDAYSNVFASYGTRTNGTVDGTEALTFLITGPDWKGELPDSMIHVQSPTEIAWMIGRVQVNSKEDGATKVRDIQDAMSLVPLDAYGNDSYEFEKGMVNDAYRDIIPVKAIQELDVNEYFNRMSMLMKDYPPPSRDSAIIRKLKRIGFVPGEPFHVSSDQFILRMKLNKLPGFIHQKLEERRLTPDKTALENGWMVVTDGIGEYGIDYPRRAYIGFIGLGACIPEDAIYPNCSFDVNGNALDARKKYTMHFEPDQIPPVNAFWSLTAYNEDEFLIENEINRFSLGDRDDLQFNDDGSLDLYIQHEAPSKEKMSNWLPITEKGPFYLTMRLYWSKEEVLNGDWKIPGVQPLD